MLQFLVIFQPLNSEITTEPFMVTLFLTVPLHVVSKVNPTQMLQSPSVVLVLQLAVIVNGELCIYI